MTTNKPNQICMEENSKNGEVLRQQLITYKVVNDSLVKHTIERVFFNAGDYSDSQTSTPIMKL